MRAIDRFILHVAHNLFPLNEYSAGVMNQIVNHYRDEADDLNINITTQEPEFSEWKWVEKVDLINLIVNFKRELYQHEVIESEDLSVLLRGTEKRGTWIKWSGEYYDKILLKEVFIIEFEEIIIEKPSNIIFHVTKGLGHRKIYKEPEIVEKVVEFLEF